MRLHIRFLLAAPLIAVVLAAPARAATAAGLPPLSTCIDQLRRELPQHPKVRPDSFNTLTATAQDLRPPIDSATQNQPEFQMPIWDYLARLVDERRLADGRTVLTEQATALARVSAAHAIDPATIVAIYGVESDFGRLTGRYPVLDATLSRACLNLASRERKAHFFAAVWLLQEGQVQRDTFRGSWAGAFGKTQFMPGTYVQYQADGDGDGRVDTVNSTADALATTANYLRGLGWVDGLPWGIEVIAPTDLARSWSSAQAEHACLAQAEPQGRCRRLGQWAALGVVRADGRPLLADGPAAGGPGTWALLTPAGPNGPAWLVSRNFRAIWHYNRADAYALAIGLLASALRDEPGIRAAWPTAEGQTALSRSGIAALQELLFAAGQCEVAADGYDGPITRQAIRNEERRRGLPETGRPTTTLLERMRADPMTPIVPCPAPGSNTSGLGERLPGAAPGPTLAAALTPSAAP